MRYLVLFATGVLCLVKPSSGETHYSRGFSSAERQITFEGSVGVSGVGLGLGGRTSDGVMLAGVIILSYEIGKYPSDEPSPGGDWYWLTPTEEYDVNTAAIGATMSIPLGQKMPFAMVFGLGVYHSAHVERLVSSATGWDWYRTSNDKYDLWYEVGGRHMFDWSPIIPGFVTISYDPVQGVALGLGTTFRM